MKRIRQREDVFAALPYIDLITLYPSSPSEGRRGIVGSNDKALSSYPVNTNYHPWLSLPVPMGVPNRDES